MHVERVFTVNKPLEAVVGYLKDFARTEAWDPGTITCTRIDEGPIVLGSRWHNVSEFRGSRTELTYELTRLEPEHLTFVGKNKTATSTDDLAFSQDGEGTSITYNATITFNGLAKLADPFLRPELKRMADDTIEQMISTLGSEVH